MVFSEKSGFVIDALISASVSASAKEREEILDRIVEDAKPFVERIINKRYPSFGEFHEAMLEVGSKAVRENALRYKTSSDEVFAAFITPFIRQAISEYAYARPTIELLGVYAHATPDEQSRIMEVVVETNKRLVNHVINKYYFSYRHNHQDDMMQQGCMAIFTHAPNFDIKKRNPKNDQPYSFSTYIIPYILDGIKTYVCSTHNISPHYAVQIKKFHAAIERLKTAGENDPTLDQIANEMGVGLDAAQKVYGVACRLNTISIDGDEKEKRLFDPYSNAPDTIFEQEELKRSIHRAIDSLPEDERAVILATFFDGDKETPLIEVARRLNMDVPRVRRLLNKAKRELGDSIELRDFSQSPEQRALENYTDALVVDFVLPTDAVEANLEIALTIDLDDELFG